MVEEDIRWVLSLEVAHVYCNLCEGLDMHLKRCGRSIVAGWRVMSLARERNPRSKRRSFLQARKLEH